MTQCTPVLPSFVVGIGASAGGLDPLIELLNEIPPDFDAAIIVALHSQPNSRLAEVIGQRTSHDVRRIETGDKLRAGTVYVLPGAMHGFLSRGTIQLSSLVEDSGFRPSIDALLMTLAAEYAERAIAVILSGTLSDGMRGAQIIHDMGGQTIVQDPQDAQYPDMPRHVIARDHPTAIETAFDLGKWLAQTIGSQ